MVTAVASHGRSGMISIVHRLGWGVIDQGVSSLSNFAVSAVVARELGASRFGAFSLAFITYTVVLNASRGVSTDPLLVRFSGPKTPAWRKAVSACTATSLAVGVLTGAVCVLVGFLLPSDLGPGFIAIGLGLPGLMLQDSWRFAYFAIGRGAYSLLIDVVWTVLLLGGLVALVEMHKATVVSCVAVFGATGTVAGLAGLALSGIVPRPAEVRHWIVNHHSLGSRYLIENVAVGGSRQLRMVAVGAVAGLAAVGQVRAAEVLMGPFLVILMGISQVAVPEASQVLRRNPHRVITFCFAIGGVQAVVAALWGVAMAVVLPMGVGHLLLGSIWKSAAALLLPITLGVVLGCFSTGATSGLRAMGIAKRSLRAQLAASALVTIGGAGGAVVGDAFGSAWGWAIGSLIGVVVWWVELRRGLADYLANPHGTHPSAVAVSEAVS